jgi:2-polyprenyl-6-methoxyphenol hydroxylase-like FAD-dependent oxidoreductase
MRHVDIAIVGGGLAGSLAAGMLGRAGYGVAVIDPHPVYPPDFRCEKLDGQQVAILRQTGLADAILAAATPDRESWVARFGCLIEQRPGDQHGILYDTLVNATRAQIPAGIARIHAKATHIATTSDRQTVTLSNGEAVTARLVVLSNGLNSGLRHRLGMVRRDLSPGHSIMLGFDLAPVGRAGFEFPALTYYGERASDRTAYLTLFPIGATMRGNLCIYRTVSDPWLRRFREAPHDTLFALLPGLRRFTGDCEVAGAIKIRPADLYVTEDGQRAGIVLVGDAFATSCPAAGTGTGKVFTDVERLCNVHVPRWFETRGMGEEKIAAFYDDPVKAAYDAHSLTKAFHLRSLSVEDGLRWRAERYARLGVGLLRQVQRQMSARRNVPQPDHGDIPALAPEASDRRRA